MKKQTEIQTKIIKLQKILASNQYIPPLFVRLRTKDENFVIPVTKIEHSEKTVNIFNGNPNVSVLDVNLEKIVSIDGLCDSQRRPLFLTNLDDPDEVELDTTLKLFQ
jgi:hypothetical protein